jgi:hypothetical protein
LENQAMAKFKSFSEFERDCLDSGFVDKVSSRYYPAKRLNHKQIQRYYLQYIKKWDKAFGDGVLDKSEEQSKDSILSAFVRERDGGCRLLKVLSGEERAEWESNHNGLGWMLDAAHIFGKAAFPWMRLDPKNVVVLNRFSHSCLDNCKSPIDGKAITDDRRKEWWKRIAGGDWEYLNSRLIRPGRN